MVAGTGPLSNRVGPGGHARCGFIRKIYTSSMAAARTLLLIVICCLLLPVSASAKEIKVSLFGQPCTLSGPFNESTLMAVHAVSPERIPAQQSLSSVKTALGQVRQAKDLPPALQTYQGRLIRRLETQFRFLEQLMLLKKAGDSKTFLEVTSKLVTAPAPYRSLLEREITQVPPRKWNAATLARVTETFETGIEPYPEEEFHRTIERAGIRYGCSFDAPSEG